MTFPLGLSIVSNHYPSIPEMENTSRGPAFGDVVTILTERLMQDNTVARLQSTRVQTPLSPLYEMFCVRVSLRTIKILLAQH
jgi:hypothetical protein